jgi:hypothetical protein
MAGTFMQIYSNLLSIWNRGFEEVWTSERIVAYNKEDKQMSSVGWAWV